MVPMPLFPDFRKIRIEDREIISGYLKEYRPVTSEMMFTNLFIWRVNSSFKWSVFDKWLLIVSETPSSCFGLMPVGPAPRTEVSIMLLNHLYARGCKNPGIEMADTRLVEELSGSGLFSFEKDRDNFDYVYSARDLIELPGRKYHAKKNHINNLLRSHPFKYSAMTDSLLPFCADLADRWCSQHRCDEDLDLLEERAAIDEILIHFSELKISGGVILIEEKVEAFTFGELLNDNTGVVYIEKANPEIPGLYAAINQMFVLDVFSATQYINREQDLGVAGLRKAKLSYHPCRLEEKFTVKLERKNEKPDQVIPPCT